MYDDTSTFSITNLNSTFYYLRVGGCWATRLGVSLSRREAGRTCDVSRKGVG